ncbi:hypothetical protein SDC9_96866 [bioreactor metagenome]|uniref:Uncharacterized protein n=1 Tax=bioreactor metagenome TaxID=1076179 RepID=A0A645ACX5_9ZZZZ
MSHPPLSRHHRTRLMQIWRSAGWPCQDAVEIELLAAGLLERHTSPEGHALLRLTDAAIAQLAQARQQGVRAASLHDRIEHRFAQQQLLPAGRIVWRELALRAALAASADAAPQPPEGPLDMFWADEGQTPSTPAQRAARRIWRVARPDLFSIRNTSVPTYLQPMVHEVKASRADLLSDLRHEAKRHAYRWLSEECYYVFPAGIAEPDELPEEFGVWVMHGQVDDAPRFELLRPARHAACALPFAVWMALCKATPLAWDEDERRAQSQLGESFDTGDAPR